MRLKVEEAEYIVEAGKHIGELSKVVETNTRYGPAILFLFKITSSNGSDIFVSGLCSKRLTPRSKLYDWLCILNGCNFDIGDSVDPEEFIGHKVELVVENSESNGRTYSNVKQLLRLIDPPF